MSALQRRQLIFWLVFAAICLVPFMLLPWYGALVILFFVLLAFGRPLQSFYTQVVCQLSSSSPNEERSYTQGYQEVAYYTPSSSPDLALPKEEPVTEEVPTAHYPEMTQRQF